MSALAETTDFDLCGPLPSGVTVLEASAGTGKTYTIAALAARYVAEGTPLERLLLITFTRIATGELRDRVRERLVSCEQQLARILAGASVATADRVTTLLATGEADVVQQRHARLARAVADFDAATIATTHGFCQEVLGELGTIGDLDPDTTFVEDVSELLEQVLDDLYVRAFHQHGDARFTRAEALKIAREAALHPMAELAPKEASAESLAGLRYRLATAVRRELERRKRRQSIMTYDDLLTRLHRILGGPSAQDAQERLRSRYSVVLVDEFQDTDPIQWQILHRAFVAEGVTLVLIADPKQAVYAFRGADVYAYLMAAKTAGRRFTLRVNRRSDQPLLDAYDALFDGARLGHEEIVYRTVTATRAHRTARLTGAPSEAALRARVVHRDAPTLEQTAKGYVTVQSARAHIARDLAADAVQLLSSPAKVAGAPLCPGHIAVLVRRNADAERVRDELQAAGVPAVINGAGNVFAAQAARDWIVLLEALARPAATARARTAALAPFFGWDAERVATASDAEWDEVHRRLHHWSRILRERGVAALTEAITTGEQLAARVLALEEGERRLTDLGHVAQLLHRAGTGQQLGVTALRGWLVERVSEAAREEADEERARRLESDAEAVQVLTIHRSKGLEFPVVYCPYLWDPSWIRGNEPLTFHDPALGYRYTIDVGLEGPAWRAHERQHRVEQRGEDLRLAYVALTRAKHRAVIWWAPSWGSGNSPLGRLLWGKDADGNVAPEGAAGSPSDDAVVQRFEALAAQAPGAFAVERSTLGPPSWWRPPSPPVVELQTASFDRHLDAGWRRTSYSQITAEAHEAPLVASEPEQPLLDDEPAGAAPLLVGDGHDAGTEPDRPAPLGALPVGVEFGTFVHRVLQESDFAAADLEAELAAHGAGQPAALAGLRAAIETPLGPLADDLRLRDLHRADRLDELEFELPLAGGEDPTGQLAPAAIAEVLRTRLPAGDPLLPYAARLEDPALRASLRGFLTGSIDLVMRLPGPRFAIADYKTNWLGPPQGPLSLRHYSRSALATEMSRAHYGLQALLYAVALHRYLRWRLRGYDPERHLAGVLYLFLRGMDGRTAGAGVFTWRPPGAAVQALSDVLDRGTP